MKTILVFILVFGVIVVVHEFGHFFFAKRAGILVREFAIGMGPKLVSFRKNETTYTLRILPIGGYVRMAGMDERDEIPAGTPATLVRNAEGIITKINLSKKITLQEGFPVEITASDLEDQLFIEGYVYGEEEQVQRFVVDHDATVIEEDGTEVQIAPKDVQFESASLGQRILTNFAGPLNNFLLTIGLFILVAFLQGGNLINDSTTIGKVVADSPAAQAGIKVGDEVLTVNGKKVTNYQALVADIQASKSADLVLSVKRGSAVKTIHVKPKMVESNGQKVPQIGIQNQVRVEKTSFFEKIAYGFTMTFSNALLIFQALGRLITGFSLNQLGGPVMIFKASQTVAHEGVVAVIRFMAMLSVNLGIMNLLPIPALDGGKLVMNFYEGLRGRPLSRDKEGWITLAGALVLVVLMVFVTWNDFRRYFF